VPVLNLADVEDRVTERAHGLVDAIDPPVEARDLPAGHGR
jgi:hypothetical protein